MFRFLRALWVDEKAAASAEYALLVALIATVIIMAVQRLGSTMGTLYSNVNSVIASAAGS